MSEGTWVTVLMVVLVFVVLLAVVGLASEAMGGVNESGLFEREAR